MANLKELFASGKSDAVIASELNAERKKRVIREITAADIARMKARPKLSEAQNALRVVATNRFRDVVKGILAGTIKNEKQIVSTFSK